MDLLTVGLTRREADLALAEPGVVRYVQSMGNVRRVLEASAGELGAITGLEPFEIMRVQSLLELGRRAGDAGTGAPTELDTPEKVMALLDDLRFEKREHFVALTVNAKVQLIRRVTIHVGTLTMSVVGAREVFREAIRDGAASIIVAHNHPSGDPTPSQEDKMITHDLIRAGRLLDIDVLDHIVIGERTCVSLRREGGWLGV